MIRPALFGFVFCTVLFSCTQNHMAKTAQDDTLILAFDSLNDSYAYVNAKGDTVIPPGKYLMAFTDTFHTFAIVSHPKKGLIGINRKEEELFKIFVFDNGPDDVKEGLFRILKNNKIGYADTTGKIIIKPQFNCAWPFENGKAKVSLDCKTISEGEHQLWESDHWFFIDKKGRVVQEGNGKQ